MLVAAAAVPTPPLLVPEVAAGSAHRDQLLRDACDEAVAAIVKAGAELVVVVGATPTTTVWTGSWDWRGLGVAWPEQRPPTRLPLTLGIGAWLLDRQSAPGRRRYQGISPQLRSSDCAELGRAHAHAAERVALLVCGDGTARRDEKAPGHYDPGARRWDERTVAALAAGDTDALLRLGPVEAARLMASARAPWQVLAGAAAGFGPFRADVLYDDAPYGVQYTVATWLAAER